MSSQQVMQPVSGTFELRWQLRRGDARPPAGFPWPEEPAALAEEARERLDEASPGT